MAVSVEVSNLGPLQSAKVQLADLTILIGQNNTGKTFFATVLHAVLQARSALESPAPWARHRIVEEIPNEARQWISSQIPDPDVSPLPIGQLDQQYTVGLTEWATQFTKACLLAFSMDVRNAIEYAFGVEEQEIRRKTRSGPTSSCVLKIQNTEPDWEVEIRFDSKDIQVKPPAPHSWLSLVGERIRSDSNEGPDGRSYWVTLAESHVRHRWMLYRRLMSELYPEWPRRAVHLPAGRGGLIQSYGLLSGLVVRQSSFAGIRPIKIPALRGTFAELLSLLVEADSKSRPNERYLSLVRAFEERLGFTIEIEQDELSVSRVIAVTQEGEFPLSRTSSMITELAPMLLLLKFPVWGADIDHLTIDEPEAHLHPRMQMQLASFIIEMAQNGFGIVLTTHSDFFLAVINNLIRQGEIGKADLSAKPSKPHIDIGGWVFSREEQGCQGRLLSRDPFDGIDDSTFTDVIEILYGESLALTNALIKQSQ